MAQMFQKANISQRLWKGFDHYIEGKKESQNSPKLIRNILQLEYPPLDDAGSDMRRDEVVKTIKKYPNFTTLLKMIYD